MLRKNIKYYAVAVLCFAHFSVFHIVFAADGSTQHGPELKIPEISKTVSPSANTQKVNTDFLISNIGDKPLVLKVERTSCGCTSAHLASEIVNPGEKTDLNVQVNVEGVSKTESVTLSTNDSTNRELTVTVQIKIPFQTRVDPPSLVIKSHAGFPTQRIVTLFLQPDVIVEQLIVQKPFLKVEAIDSIPIVDGKRERIKVLLTADAPSGSFTDNLIINLKDSSTASFTVPINGNVVRDVQVQPDSIFMGRIPSESTFSKIIKVMSYSGKAFQIVKVISNNSMIQAETDLSKSPAVHIVKVNIFIPKNSYGYIDNSLKIFLTNGQMLEVPVVGMVKN